MGPENKTDRYIQISSDPNNTLNCKYCDVPRAECGFSNGDLAKFLALLGIKLEDPSNSWRAEDGTLMCNLMKVNTCSRYFPDMVQAADKKKNRRKRPKKGV